MSCPVQDKEQAELLLAFCARRLDSDTRAYLERHMDSCPECRRFVEQQRLVWEALDAWEAMPVSREFDRRLYTAVDREADSGWWRRLPRPALGWSWRPAFSVAAAAVTIVAIVLLQSPRAADLRAPAPRAEGVDIEQVELVLKDMEMLEQLDPVLARAENVVTTPDSL